MSQRPILTAEHPALRTKATKVTAFDEDLATLVADMWETLIAVGGAGLAAPQIGITRRVLVAWETLPNRAPRQVTLVNPCILKRSSRVVPGTEACLSIPGYEGRNIPRAHSITVQGRDVTGKQFQVVATDWFARVLQHELDHLDGILFIDRLPHPDEDFHPIPASLARAATAVYGA